MVLNMPGELRVPTAADVLNNHLTAFMHQDLDAVLRDYTDDSVIITNMGTFRGLDDIEALFRNFFTEFSQNDISLTIDEETVTGDVAYFVWHAETPDNVYEFATDTLLVRDGRIETQTFAAKVTPKN